MSEEVEAWHFVNESKTFRYDDKTKVVVGKKYCVNPEKLELCAFGLHASIRPIDAIEYAPGPIVCRVKLSGKIIHSDDKLVASERTVLWMADATNTLHEFACLCADDVLPLFEAKYPDDKRPRLAIEAKRKWLRGEITDEGLAAARAAVCDAARAAAGDAALAAAWDAARAAVRDRQNQRLEEMLLRLKPND